MINFARAAGLVTCDTNCGWPALVAMAARIIDYLILVSGSLAAISFAYAGWMYMTSGGDSGKVSRAKGIFLKVVIGLIFVLAAWLLVHEILRILGVTDPDFSLIGS
jgi:hypothetical protein